MCAFKVDSGCQPGNDQQISSPRVIKESRASSRLNGHHAEWEVCLHLDQRRRSQETLRRNSDNRYRSAVNQCGLVDYSGIAMEARLPIPIAEYNDRIAAGCVSFAGKDEASEIRLNPEHLEEIAGNEQSLGGPGYCIHG